MSRLEQVRPGPGLIVAILALVAALAGTAVAGPTATTSGLSKKKVKKLTTSQIKELAPTLSVDHANSADSAGTAGSASSANNANSANTANRAVSAAQVDTLQVDPVNVAASTDPVGSAPKVELLRYGPFTVYGKCFGSIAAGVPVSAPVFIETTQAGAVMTSDEDHLVGPGAPGDPAGGGYLDPATSEKDRELSIKAVTSGVGTFGHDQSAFDAVRGSVKVQGQVAAYAKQGEPPTGDPGTYGPGDRCIFDAYGTQEGA